jgi:hypothetical protein
MKTRKFDVLTLISKENEHNNPNRYGIGQNKNRTECQANINFKKHVIPMRMNASALTLQFTRCGA